MIDYIAGGLDVWWVDLTTQSGELLQTRFSLQGVLKLDRTHIESTLRFVKEIDKLRAQG